MTYKIGQDVFVLIYGEWVNAKIIKYIPHGEWRCEYSDPETKEVRSSIFSDHQIKVE